MIAIILVMLLLVFPKLANITFKVLLLSYISHFILVMMEQFVWDNNLFNIYIFCKVWVPTNVIDPRNTYVMAYGCVKKVTCKVLLKTKVKFVSLGFQFPPRRNHIIAQWIIILRYFLPNYFHFMHLF
jgi:hypothetical protein